jgi:phage terminase large subunit
MNWSDSTEKRLDYRVKRVGVDRDSQDVESELCARDIVHWINHWGWTYDPREPNSLLPFDLFPRQCDFLNWLAAREAEQESGVVEKSRDVGMTWLCVAYSLHGWLFRPGFAAGFGSRKLDLVDKRGDPDCIFEKLRFLLDNLPGWMRPAGFDPKRHDNEARFVNPASGATITGEGGDQIGRGGRKTIYFVDEAAFLEHPESIERSLSQTTRCRIDVSTPNGPGNPFARKRFSGKLPVFTFHWRDDPRKGEAWYAGFKSKHDPVTVAQEADIDYSASVEGICIPAAWVRAAINLSLPESGKTVCGLDIADEGKAKSVLIPRRGPVASRPIAWGQTNTTETAWKARDHAIAAGAAAVCYDSIGVGAGVKGTWQTSEKPLPFLTFAVNVGESPSESVWPDGQSSKEKFLNLRAEIWWKLRARFERSYEYRELGVRHEPASMISIPDDPDLIAELSLPLVFRTDTGKIKLESKDAMRKRGVKSPDYGDSLALAFYDGICLDQRVGLPTRETSTLLGGRLYGTTI